MRLKARIEKSQALKRPSRPALKLDPNDFTTFRSQGTVLHNNLVHSTDEGASRDILSSRTFKSAVPTDERYDGFFTEETQLDFDSPSRVYFRANPSSDGVMLPFSVHPKSLDGGSPIKLIQMGVQVLLNEDFSMFYIRTTPSQFGQNFQTVYHSHVAVVRTDRPQLPVAKQANFQLLNKRENAILSFNSRDEAVVSSSVRVENNTYPHSVVVCFLGELYCPPDVALHATDGYKVSYSNGRVKCPIPNCAAFASSYVDLKQHYAAAHLSLRQFECASCDSKFLYKSNLSQHVASTHGDVRHVCEECGRVFAQKGNLNVHSASVHRTERPRMKMVSTSS